jgi:HK97 family phage portal protein
MTSLLGKVLNRAPVSYVPRTDGIGRALQRVPSSGRQLNAMSTTPTLFSIVNRTSTALSAVEWHLYRKQTDARRVTPMPGQRADRTEVIRHAAVDLWNKPNPFMDGSYYREASQQHVDLVGECTTIIGRAPGIRTPLELWPVRPDRMTPIPSPTEFLAGWIYTGPNGEQVPFGVDEVIQIKMPNPVDPYRGLGPVQALLIDLEAAEESAAWNRNFFRNSAEPAGVIEFENDLSDDEFRQFQDRWRETHQGTTNAHRVAMLEFGMKWKPATFSPRDMQFVELRNVAREIIREGFGIHGHMLGNSENVNKADAEAGESMFAKWLTVPRARRWKNMLNFTLLPMFETGDSVEFDHDRVVPEDREADDRERTSKANAANSLVAAGYDQDDVAKAVGLPDMRAVREPVSHKTPGSTEPAVP